MSPVHAVLGPTGVNKKHTDIATYRLNWPGGMNTVVQKSFYLELKDLKYNIKISLLKFELAPFVWVSTPLNLVFLKTILFWSKYEKKNCKTKHTYK